MKGKAGKPTTNNAIYGYKKDPEDKDHWLVDEEAAAVVRRIFRLAVEGHGPYAISKMLTAEKVECPGYYLAKQRAKKKKQGKKSGTSMLDKNRPYDWYGNTVSTLLERPEYMGHTVNFRSSKKSYRDKRVKNAPEEWLIFENTHEAIVDPETWQLAQQVKRTVRRTDTTGVANPLTGLVFCADCGAKMYNHRGIRKKADGKEYPSDFYNCSTYCLTIERETKQCFSHNVSTKALTELVLETIRTTASYAISNREEFIQKVRSISQVRQQEVAKELKRKVAKAQKRIAELDMLIKKLYETYAMGKLEEKRFEMLSAEYEKEQDKLEQTLASDQASLGQFNEDTDRANKFLALAKKYTDFSELTAPMINEFVEKIVVHAPDRSTGERIQEIEIYLISCRSGNDPVLYAGEPPGNRGLSFFVPEGRTYSPPAKAGGGSPPVGRARALISGPRAACGGCPPKRTCGCSPRGIAAPAGVAGRCHSPVDSAVIAHAVIASTPAFASVSRGTVCTPALRQLPAKTCHRQLCRRYGYRCSGDTHFLFAKKKQKRREGENEWQSTIWKQKWSAGAMGVLLLPLPPI